MCHDVHAVGPTYSKDRLSSRGSGGMNLKLSAVTRPVERLMATAQNGLEVLRLGGLETGAVSSTVPGRGERADVQASAIFSTGQPAGTAAGGPAGAAGAPDDDVGEHVGRHPRGGRGRHTARRGLDPWVIDFGSPDQIEGGMRRNLADHIVALSEALEVLVEATGQDVHLAGYSQGGMFCYQAAAYRRSKSIASIVTFGSPVDTLAALPMGIPPNLAAAAANFMADHVFNRLDIPSWLARTGFQMLDPLKTAKARIDFVRQLHDREALLPREAQRRFLESEGWIAWSGPAVSELLKQFIAHNRMMTGGFAINGQLVTLTDITCPVLAFVGEVDDIGQPPSVRGIRRAAPNAEVYEYMMRAGHFGLVVGSKAAQQTWPTVADWVMWISGHADKPAGIVRMADQPEQQADRGVAISSRLAHGVGEASEVALTLARSAADAVVAANKSMRTMAVGNGPDVASTGPARPDQRSHSDFAGQDHR